MAGSDLFAAVPVAALVAGGAVSGAVIGSFLGNLCVRWPRGEAVSRGRSHCDHCGRTLRAWELIPLASAFILKSRCRTCAAPIDPLHARVEWAAMLIGGAAMAWSPDASGAALALFGWLLLPLAVLDARHYWLPDKLVAWLAVTGLALGGWVSDTSLFDRLIGGVAGGAVLGLVAWAYAKVRGREGLGGGDPKLVAALGCWLGWAMLPPLLLVASALGLIWALIWAQKQDSPAAAPQMVPFGTMLALATGPVLFAWPMITGG